MRIVKSFPPNYAEIIKAIPGVKLNPNIIFTYGETLYVPSGNDIPDHLMAHEMTHTLQQDKLGIDEWWAEYLVNPRFRLEQELQAYRAQYKVLLHKHPRHVRKFVLLKISADLAGSMYGKIVDKDQARKLITGGAQL
jgi:hypothetical protein